MKLTESHLTQMAFLTQGLVRIAVRAINPSRSEFVGLLDAIEVRIGRFDPHFDGALDALVRLLPDDRPLTRPGLRIAAEKLLAGRGEARQQMGRALSWALELTEARRGQSSTGRTRRSPVTDPLLLLRSAA